MNTPTTDTHTPFNVLVLCTGNSARSIMAEALINRLGNPRIRAYSAGSHPVGVVNPYALAQLAAHGCSVEGLRSKRWDEFDRPGGPPIDLVIIVCANAAHENCPVWPGGPPTVHWGLPDPAAAGGTEQAIAAAFASAFDTLQRWIRDWLAAAPPASGNDGLLIAAGQLAAQLAATSNEPERQGAFP